MKSKPSAEGRKASDSGSSSGEEGIISYSEKGGVHDGISTAVRTTQG